MPEISDATHEHDPLAETTLEEAAIPRISVEDWVADRDDEISDALRVALETEPDRAASEEERIQHMQRLAELTGRRQMLDAAAIALAATQGTSVQKVTLVKRTAEETPTQPQLPFDQTN